MNLLDSLFRSSAVDNLFTDRAPLQGMLDFEAALARAEVRVGVIPAPRPLRSAQSAARNSSILQRWRRQPLAPEILPYPS